MSLYYDGWTAWDFHSLKPLLIYIALCGSYGFLRHIKTAPSWMNYQLLRSKSVELARRVLILTSNSHEGTSYDAHRAQDPGVAGEGDAGSVVVRLLVLSATAVGRRWKQTYTIS